MSAPSYYAKGQWKACCDFCGKVFKSNDLLLTWDGYRSCRETCFETRSPQELLRAPRPERPIPWSRNCSGCGASITGGTRVLDSKLSDRISTD